MNSEKRKTPPVHGPMRGVGEKAKDFKGSIKRLITELDSFKKLVFISLILASLGSVLSILSPNKLKDLTNEVAQGLAVDTNNMKKITKKITANYMIKNVSFDNKEQLQDINSYEDITIDDTLITRNDQVEFMKIASTLNKDSDPDTLYKNIDLLPSSIKKVIEPKMNINKIKQIAIFLAILYIVSALFTYIESIIMTIVSNKFARKLRSIISMKINKLPLKYFDTHKSGDILSRITNDIDTISQTMNHSLATLVSSITLFVGTMIMMFVTNVIMAITAIVSSLIGFIFMAIVLKKSQDRKSVV